MSNLSVIRAINDASMLITALAPLLEQAQLSGTEVTLDDLKDASASLGKKIDTLDALIVAKEAEENGGAA